MLTNGARVDLKDPADNSTINEVEVSGRDVVDSAVTTPHLSRIPTGYSPSFDGCASFNLHAFKTGPFLGICLQPEAVVGRGPSRQDHASGA